jgi:bacillithiol system protein YtxJ
LGLFGKPAGASLPASWQQLTDIAAWQSIAQASALKPQLIIKHSTRCSISHMALARLQQAAPELATYMDIHYLDLLAHREASNAIAELTQVAHQSPQALLIYQGECVLEQTHGGIYAQELVEEAQRVVA